MKQERVNREVNRILSFYFYSMKCKSYNVELIRGITNGAYWIEGKRKEDLKKGVLGKVVALDSMSDVSKTEFALSALSKEKKSIEFINAYKCPKCKRIEFYTEEIGE